MSEFFPDYSNPQALRSSYLARAKEMRASAMKAINPIVRSALLADAEMAERIADEIAEGDDRREAGDDAGAGRR